MRTHAVTCALWTSSAAGRSTISSTVPPLLDDTLPTAAQGPRSHTNLTRVLAAQSGAPGRPRTPNSKQAHRHQGKETALRATPGSSLLFMRPRASAKRTDELKASALVVAAKALPRPT